MAYAETEGISDGEATFTRQASCRTVSESPLADDCILPALPGHLSVANDR